MAFEKPGSLEIPSGRWLEVIAHESHVLGLSSGAGSLALSGRKGRNSARPSGRTETNANAQFCGFFLFGVCVVWLLFFKITFLFRLIKEAMEAFEKVPLEFGPDYSVPVPLQRWAVWDRATPGLERNYTQFSTLGNNGNFSQSCSCCSVGPLSGCKPSVVSGTCSDSRCRLRKAPRAGSALLLTQKGWGSVFHFPCPCWVCANGISQLLNLCLWILKETEFKSLKSIIFFKAVCVLSLDHFLERLLT